MERREADRGDGEKGGKGGMEEEGGKPERERCAEVSMRTDALGYE